MKSDKKTFVAPAIVFTPLQSVTPAQGGGHPTTGQPLVHTWPRPLVILSQATPWAARPPIPSASELSSVQNNCHGVLALPSLFDYLIFPYRGHREIILHLFNK